MGVAALAVLLLVGGGAWWFTREREPEFKGITLAQVAPAPDFELTKPDGSTFRLSEDRGQVTLLFFGYTNCPDVCPMKMRAFGQVAERLGDDAGRVGLVFVTVDPERDTPEQLAAYAARYSDHITALGGDLEDLERVWELYGIRSEIVETPDSALGYVVNHSTQVFLIDKAGNVRLLYGNSATADDMLHDIKILLNERGGAV